MIGFANPLREEEVCISEALISRLHHASDETVLSVVSAFHANQKASLALHCYRKSHLRQTGLTIASTCELNSLVDECGPIIGKAIFVLSRDRIEEPKRAWGRLRPTVSLASAAGGSYSPLEELEDMPTGGEVTA
jgi:hypothetical protein